MTDRDAVALVVWGEARGSPIEEKLGVASVIRNRVLAKYGGQTTYLGVCLAHAQFSAWTEEAAQMQAEAGILASDPSLEHHPDPVLRLCWEIANATTAGLLCDNSKGANHYMTVALYEQSTPVWAKGTAPLVQLGSQVFFNVA